MKIINIKAETYFKKREAVNLIKSRFSSSENNKLDNSVIQSNYRKENTNTKSIIQMRKSIGMKFKLQNMG